MAVFIMAESDLMVDASIDDDFMADGRIAGWFWIQLFQLEVSCDRFTVNSQLVCSPPLSSNRLYKPVNGN